MKTPVSEWNANTACFHLCTLVCSACKYIPTMMLGRATVKENHPEDFVDNEQLVICPRVHDLKFDTIMPPLDSGTRLIILFSK